MITLKDTIRHCFIEGCHRRNTNIVGPLELSMVSLKDIRGHY